MGIQWDIEEKRQPFKFTYELRLGLKPVMGHLFQRFY